MRSTFDLFKQQRLFVTTAITLSLVILSGCTGITSKPVSKETTSENTWLKHRSTLKQVQDWQIKGRFSAKTATETWSGSIIWRQQKDQQYTISISGPLSTGSILLTGDQNFAQLQLSESQFATDTNPQSLLFDYTGLKLPVNELKYWLLGLPQPKSTNSTIALNKNGQLQTLSQSNWDITFKRYTSVDQLQLPNKIFLTNRDISVRLIIQQWQIGT